MDWPHPLPFQPPEAVCARGQGSCLAQAFLRCISPVEAIVYTNLVGYRLRTALLTALLARFQPHREEAFSKVKRFLQMIGARTRGALLEVIGTALDEVSTKNAKGFFAHCGYHTLEQ